MPVKRFLARVGKARSRRLRHSAAAPVVIRHPVSTWRRMVILVGSGLLALVLGAGLFLAGQISVGDDRFLKLGRIKDLASEVDRLKSENARLTEAYNSTSTQLEIERGARKPLESQVGHLEDERNRLNRDLALFDNLFPADAGSSQPSIRSFRVEPIIASGSPSAWRFRALVMRGGKAKDSFKGMFRLQVRYRLNGREIMADTPESGRITEPIELQRYRRVEGHFRSPPGATLLGATAQVMQNERLITELKFHP